MTTCLVCHTWGAYCALGRSTLLPVRTWQADSSSACSSTPSLRALLWGSPPKPPVRSYRNTCKSIDCCHDLNYWSPPEMRARSLSRRMLARTPATSQVQHVTYPYKRRISVALCCPMPACPERLNLSIRKTRAFCRSGRSEIAPSNSISRSW